jgi:hypothetical protein
MGKPQPSVQCGEKNIKSRWENGMIGWANNQAPELGPAHDFKCI